MYEHIRPVLPPNESVSFRVIEPLHGTLHFVSPWVVLNVSTLGADKKHTSPRARIARECTKMEMGVKGVDYEFYECLCMIMYILIDLTAFS
jgi:hypothetical protein